MASPRHDPFLAIASPARRRLLDLLTHEDQSAKALASHAQMSPSAICRHLRLLRAAGLVAERRVGRERHYRVNGARLRVVHEWVVRYESFWRERIEALEHAFDGIADPSTDEE